MKFPSELHQNLQYFWIMKTHEVVLIFSLMKALIYVDLVLDI